MKALVRYMCVCVGSLSFSAWAGLSVVGKISANTTWTKSNSPIVLTGDVTVAQGVVLEIEPGVQIKAEAVDSLASGEDPNRVEFIVQGSLNVKGTPDSQVVFTTDAGVGSWLGLRFETMAGFSTLAGVVIEKAYRSITVFAPVNLQDSILRTQQDSCIVQFASALRIERSMLDSCGRDALFVASGSNLVMKQTVVTSSGSLQFAVRIQGQAELENCTIVRNTYGGIEIFGNAPVAIRNTIVAYNNRFGIRQTGSAPLDYSYSNTFGHTVNLDRNGKTITGLNNLAVDPQFMGFNDFSLQPNSPCRKTGLGGIDMGAFQSKELVDRLVVSLTRVVTPVKGTATLWVEARDKDGNLVPTSFTWKVDARYGTIVPNAGDTSKATFKAACMLGEFVDAIQVIAGGKSGYVTVKVDPGNPSALKINPADVEVEVGDTTPFTAQAVDECVNPLPTNVTWATTAGVISSTGVLTAPTVPKVYTDAITAQMGSLVAKATVRVKSGAVTELKLNSQQVSAVAAKMVTLTAVAKDKFGNVSPEPITWTVDAAAGSMSGNGNWTAGQKAGTYNDAIVAQAGGVTAKATAVVVPDTAATVTVTPKLAKLAPKGITTFRADVKDAFGNITNDSVEWTTTHGEVGSIVEGVFTASTQAGNYPKAIKARVGTALGSADVIIEPGALSQLVLTPARITVQVGGTYTFNAVGKDEFGNAVKQPVTWTAQTGGTINADGVFTAGKLVGTFEKTVMAEMNGVAATATVDVTPGPVAFLTVSPDRLEIMAGQQQIFTVKAKDFHGNVVEKPEVIWTCESQAGNITPAGVFTARSIDASFPRGVTATSNRVAAHVSLLVLKTTSERVETVSACSSGNGAAFLPGVWLALALLRRRSRASAQNLRA